MRKLAKMFAVLALVAAAPTTGLMSVHAKSLSPCYYDVHSDTKYGAIHLTDGNYVNVTLSIWEVDSLDCSAWAGHAFGDAEVEVEANLGTVKDYFVDALNPISMFGCTPCGVTHVPYNINAWANEFPPHNGANAPWTNFGGGNGDVWGIGSPANLTGTDGDTTIYENSSFFNASCYGNAGLNPVWVGDGASNFWPSEVDISGNPYFLPLYTFFVPGTNGCSCIGCTTRPGTTQQAELPPADRTRDVVHK